VTAHSAGFLEPSPGPVLSCILGDDSFNRMTESEVATVTSFLQNAPNGPVYPALDNAPLADTATQLGSG
jgi:hypothetical protein